MSVPIGNDFIYIRDSDGIYHPCRDTTARDELNTKADKNHTHTSATNQTAGFMSAADKAKLDGLDTGAKAITVDTVLSSSSSNPVENKAIYSALEKKSDTSHTHDRFDNDLEIGGAYCLLVKVVKGKKGITLTDENGKGKISIDSGGVVNIHSTGTLEINADTAVRLSGQLRLASEATTRTMKPAADDTFNLGGSGNEGDYRYKTIYANLIDTGDVLLGHSAYLSPYSSYNGTGPDIELKTILSDFKRYMLALNNRVTIQSTDISAGSTNLTTGNIVMVYE